MPVDLARPYQLMARYNRWMNANLYAACAKLDDATRKQDRGAFFGSIHGTLNHLMFGDLVWFGRFIDRPNPPMRHNVLLYEDFEPMQAARSALDEEIVAWADQLTPDWLAAPFTYRNLAGQPFTRSAFILVSQLFNHGTHHRGQLTTLLFQAGIDPGVTDIPYMPGLSDVEA